MPRPLSMAALGLALACGREVVFVDPPPASRDTDTTGADTTVVTRVDLELTVTIASVDSALAARLGIHDGRLAGAEVTARRPLGQQEPQHGSTDAVGHVTLPGLLEGTWAITVLRALTDGERSQLDSVSGDVTGFAGATRVLVSDRTPAVAIAARAGRQGTLVISEAYLPVIAEVFRYDFGQYLEVHNNSFDTLYLDGKIIATSLPWTSGTSTNSCADLARWMEDPEGIWTQSLWAFPGSGAMHPLPPGASAVVATDAVDHRVVRSDLLDLSAADFEFIGAENTDVDNPAVPNMREFPGWSDWGDAVVGHGLYWGNHISVFLAEPLHPDSLVHDNLPVVKPLHARVPRDRILDVLTSGATPERQFGPYCPNFVHPSFDGGFAELVDWATAHSLTRRPLMPELGLLLRTKVSAVDFTHQPPTPRRSQ